MVRTFHKTYKNSSYSYAVIQKMCLSEISGPDLFLHVNLLISRMKAVSRVKRCDDSPKIVGLFTAASFFQIGSVQHNSQIEP